MKRAKRFGVLLAIPLIVGLVGAPLAAYAYAPGTSYTWAPGDPNYNASAVIHTGTIDTTRLIFGDFLGRSSTQPLAQGFGDSGVSVNWDDTWKGNVGHANTNGDALDGLWVQNYRPTGGWWDLGRATNKVAVFTSQDHGPYLAEGLEYRLYGSNTLWDDGSLSTQATLTDVYLDGWRIHNATEDSNGNGWCSDDIAGVYQLPGKYRYVKLVGWSSTYNEPEIDAVAVVPCIDTPQYPQVKVAQVPIPWQFWAIVADPETGERFLIDRIRISPTWLDPQGDEPVGEGSVFIQRQVVVWPEMVPLELLVWDPEGPVPRIIPPEAWDQVDPEPIPVPVDQDIDLPIPLAEIEEVGGQAVIVAYEVKVMTELDGEMVAVGHFINEAILESESPQAIVQILVNFDIHNGTGRDDITNFELDFFNLDFGCEDVVWALGFVKETGEPWGANPLVVRPIKGGTEVKWVETNRPLKHCEWLHGGLMFNLNLPGFDNPNATVQGYWTVHRGTPGYWKNHPEAWPMEEITVGGVTYTEDEAIAFLRTPGKGDKTYTMFAALVAAKLNVANGTDPCITEIIKLADVWMYEHGPVGSGVRGRDDAWQAGEGLYERLDEYNNGWYCPLPRP